MVVAFDVLEHIKNDHLAVKEITRVLKKGVIFIFTVSALNFLYSHHDKFLEHYRRYDKDSLKKLLNDFNFKLNY
ncbi:methyltransferase domain-containing protein [Candidatus Dependentiae bacterium]|nr:methyltransferase domain-containing protein [Candidatus Dependentiae bacterium]